MSIAQPTLDDVWLLFRESSQQFKEVREQAERDREQAERDREQAERDREQAERDRAQTEKDRAQTEKDREQAKKEREQDKQDRKQAEQEREQDKQDRKQAEQEREARYEKNKKEMDREIKEIWLEIRQNSKETDAKLEKVGEHIRNLGNRLGEYVEEMVRPAAVRLFRERGIDVHEIHQNIKSKRNNEGIEVDLLLINEIDAVAIECKSNFSMDDVKDHLKRLEKFKRVLPTYANKKLMGAITGMVLADNVARYAYKKGLFVITQTGEQLIIRNDLEFKAKYW